MTEFFTDVTAPIPFAGSGATGDLAYRVYDPNRIVAGKRMEDHLRIAVCYWHSFNWPGSDIFGVGTFDRPWLQVGVDPIEAAFANGELAHSDESDDDFTTGGAHPGCAVVPAALARDEAPSTAAHTPINQ